MSVGKNLHALTTTVGTFGAQSGEVLLCGLDLERFNPQLSRLYPREEATCRRWPTPARVDDGSGSATLKADAESSLCEHTIVEAVEGSRVRLMYASADLKTHAAWRALKDGAHGAADGHPGGGE